jgi:hypothetical protein
MIGQAHAATAANAILGTFPSLLGSESGCRRGVRRWVAHRTRQLGFEIATPAALQFRNTSIFDTCLNAFEFQEALHAMLFLLSRCTWPISALFG